MAVKKDVWIPNDMCMRSMYETGTVMEERIKQLKIDFLCVSCYEANLTSLRRATHY